VRVFTIGHSTRTAVQFLELLHAHGIDGIADVRRFPASRRHPQYSRDALSDLLVASGRRYLHIAELGGRRHGGKASRNTAWQNASFRAYADYMASEPFKNGIDTLLAFARVAPTAIMCAEAQWWRCHRQLISDALVARGIDVHHIMSPAAAPAHQLTPFARVEGEQVWYPALF
jgi:uncharacterized protein (DUF488 family)